LQRSPCVDPLSSAGVKPLAGSAAAAMADGLAVPKEGGIASGALFRRIRKGVTSAEPPAPAAVRDIVKERGALAGVGGQFSAPLAARGLRDRSQPPGDVAARDHGDD
jgi:hypothetical protein